MCKYWKSPCQLRLEERSLAYQRQIHCVDDPKNHPQEQLTRRIAQAAERRMKYQSQISTKAQQRSIHVQRVVDAQRTARRAAKMDSMKKLENAHTRREAKVEQMLRRLSSRWEFVELTKDRVQGAKLIQRWYRRQVGVHKTMASLQVMKKDVESIVRCWDQMREAGFDESMRMLQKRELARSAQRVTNVFLLAPTTATELTALNGTSGSSLSFRVLLMAGMIVCHPQSIMESQPSERLSYGAKQLDRDFHLLLEALRSGPARLLKSVVSCLHARFLFYADMFAWWKERDAKRLAKELLDSYEEILKTKITYESKPIEHENDGMHELIYQTQLQLNQLQKALIRVIGKESTERHISQISEGVMEGRSQEAVVVSTMSKFDDPPAELEMLSSDEKLIHEIILNPEFQVLASNDTFQENVKQIMVRAYWDKIIQTNDLELLVIQISELKSSIQGLFYNRADLCEPIEHALDANVWSQFLANPVESAEGIKERCAIVLECIRKGESPGRNDSTIEFSSTLESSVQNFVGSSSIQSPISLLAEFLAFCWKKSEEIRADMLNVHVGVLATYLKRHGIEYEQRLVERRIAAGRRLEFTEKWLAGHFPSHWDSLDQIARARMIDGDSLQHSKFLRSSAMELILRHIEGTTGVWPESFEFDINRIRSFRDAMDRVVIIASLTVVLQQYAVHRQLRGVHSTFSKFRDQMDTLLQTPQITANQLVAQALEVARTLELEAMRRSGDGMLQDELQRLQIQLENVFQKGNPVYRLLFSRISDAVSASVISNAKVVIHPSLKLFQSTIESIATGLTRLSQHNEQVYAKYHNQIVQKLLKTVS